jgi:hypothetical protein
MAKRCPCGGWQGQSWKCKELLTTAVGDHRHFQKACLDSVDFADNSPQVHV